MRTFTEAVKHLESLNYSINNIPGKLVKEHGVWVIQAKDEKISLDSLPPLQRQPAS